MMMLIIMAIMPVSPDFSMVLLRADWASLVIESASSRIMIL